VRECGPVDRALSRGGLDGLLEQRPIIWIELHARNRFAIESHQQIVALSGSERLGIDRIKATLTAPSCGIGKRAELQGVIADILEPLDENRVGGSLLKKCFKKIDGSDFCRS